MIGAIKISLETESLLERSPLLLLAQTEVAKFNISTSKIHSTLHIPLKKIIDLQRSSSITLQEEMKHVKNILIDEMSFNGRNLLKKIDSRLDKLS